MKDYNEILLTAIDTVVAQRLQELQFDETIICTIVDDSDKKNGHYRVTDGSITFDAYTETTYYYNDNQVYVTIPKGDWTARKLITGRYTADDVNDPIVYVSPLEQIAKLTQNFVPKGETDASLAANWGDKSGAYIKEIGNIGDISINTAINDTLCIKADFRCNLDNYDMLSGAYGILIKVETDQGATATFMLDSGRDMFGVPYAYTAWAAQQQAYRFTTPIGNITNISWSLYQDGDFKYRDEDGTIKPIEPNETAEGVQSDIYVRNIEIFFGTDVSSIKDNTVKIVTFDDIKYRGGTEANKNIELVWYNKGEGNKFLGFSDGKFNKDYAMGISERVEGDDNNYYWIQWYLDNQDGSLEEIIPPVADTMLQEELVDIFTKINIQCHPELLFTEVQAIVWLNGTQYKSNLLQFDNQTELASLVINKDITISIVNGDNSQDAYPLYGEDNKIIKTADAMKNRTVKIQSSWSKGILTDKFWGGAVITWTLPQNSTMLVSQFREESGDIAYSQKYEIKKEHYDESGKLDWSKFTCSYRISDVYHDLYNNNTITCSIKIPNQEGELTATKYFGFSSQGTSGVDYTLVVRPVEDEWVFGSLKENINQYFTAVLLDLEGKTIDSTIELTYEDSIDNKNVVSEDYNVVKASTEIKWADRDVTLETLYPVCYAAEGYSADVPLKIIYDSYGTLKNMVKSGVPLKLYEDGSLVDDGDVTWRVELLEDPGDEDVKTLLPRISEEGERNTLIPPMIYVSDLNNKSYLVAQIGEEIVWTSPIIMQQYRYNSDVLNSWDGQTTIDNEGNKILTNAFAAGYMDEYNTFNGVILGEVGKITEENTWSRNTGLFGYNAGEQAFGFRDDGTAFIGKSGAGCIEFDGEKGVIQSGNFQNIINGYTNAGMYINLKDGDLHSKNFYIDTDGNAFFKGDISGASGTFSGTLNIGNKNAFIVSESEVKFGENFSVSSNGTVTVRGDIQAESLTIGNNNIGINEYVGGVVKATTIQADKITGAMSSNVTIGGWSIGSNDIRGVSSDSVYTALISKAAIGTSNNVVFGVAQKINGKDTYLAYIDGQGVLHATGAQISGDIVATKLTIADSAIPSNIAKSSSIPTKNSQLVNDSGFKNESGVVSIVKGTVTADYVNAFAIRASSILIKDKASTLLSAGDNKVSIGSWKVGANGFVSESPLKQSAGVKIGSSYYIYYVTISQFTITPTSLSYTITVTTKQESASTYDYSSLSELMGEYGLTEKDVGKDIDRQIYWDKLIRSLS